MKYKIDSFWFDIFQGKQEMWGSSPWKGDDGDEICPRGEGVTWPPKGKRGPWEKAERCKQRNRKAYK